ncbi:DUF559 domain-containing protein, partial [Frigoribacterium sp. UYMn621]|uniref:endonuclease domain-containing protein n=1 Tax=Frigoribacterium sp. UYMn621 TaxID=3156343 RepID=UPI00339A6EAF
SRYSLTIPRWLFTSTIQRSKPRKPHHSRGRNPQSQVCVLGERWIDLLIGDRLAIEIDGAAKYTQDMSPGEVARRVDADRVRDAFLEALGYHVIRLSYRMIVFDWPATLAMIQAVIERGDHLSRR